MNARKVMILMKMDFPQGTSRFWFGSCPYIDANGDHWRAAGELPETALSTLQYSFSGEAVVMEVGLSGVPQDIADLAYEETQEDDVIGSEVQILLQSCDQYFQPVGDPVVKFTGEIIDLNFHKAAVGDQAQPHILHQVIVVVANVFHARKSRRNAVLSDSDQKALSLKLNPDLPADLSCERVSLMNEQTITWPRA
ncbi:hypothetical protein [Pseudovibrio sp. POLY-S9]|uniref:hypothetical protein n=1 Tax=Pseudovibrio sp. POLY-S9 TaxID=1576596 RepID=UPI000710CE7E|nr:hypothetical protein [Pseudovibrio sp. POLY-S9]